MTMPDYPDTRSFHYLPVELTGQVFAIPMADVAAIHRLGGDGADDLAGRGGQAGIPVVDLGRLFSPDSQPSDTNSVYGVVISTPAFTYAVLVDSVRPSRKAEPAKQFALSPLIAQGGCLFSKVLREPDGLMPVIDTQRLAAELRRVGPGLVVERAHAI